MKNGTYIADLAVEEPAYSGNYRKVGALLYFRSHEAKVKVCRFGNGFIGGDNIIGLFRKSDKVDEAPYIEGDLFLNKEKIGHIHSQQNEVGDSMYWLRVNESIRPSPDCDIWLTVKLEDEEL
jgi:hypothetical protein